MQNKKTNPLYKKKIKLSDKQNPKDYLNFDLGN